MAGLSSVGFSGNDGEVDLDSFRARLRKMTDAELQRDIRPILWTNCKIEI
jgi:hypothetical protein